MSQLIYKFYGGVAERFRHGFAKPRTRVRIPSPPHSNYSKCTYSATLLRIVHTSLTSIKLGQMYSKVKTIDELPKNLYKDKILWIQVSFGTLFFVTSGIWVSAVPLGIKYNLHHNETVIGITGLIFALGAWSSRFVANSLVKKYSKHEIIFVGLVLMLIAGLIPYFAPNLAGIMISRVFNGLADSLAYIGLSTLVVANSREEEQGKALSLYTICLYLGVGLGPIIGEVLYRFSPDNILQYSGLAVVAIALVLMYLLQFVKTRYRPVHEETKKTSVFAKPVLLPGLIFMLGMGTYVGFVQFASVFARNIGINDSSTFYLLLGLGVVVLRTLFSSVFDRVNAKVLLYVAVSSSFIAALIFSTAKSSILLYIAIVFLIVSNGIFYPALVLCALRRSTSYDKSTILGSLGVFFDTAFGILPIFLGYLASELSYSTMFVIVSGCSIAGVFLISSMRLPKGAETIEV